MISRACCACELLPSVALGSAETILFYPMQHHVVGLTNEAIEGERVVMIHDKAATRKGTWNGGILEVVSQVLKLFSPVYCPPPTGRMRQAAAMG